MHNYYRIFMAGLAAIFLTSCESIWNLSLYNAYCRMNPFVAMVALEYDDIYNENWNDFSPVKYTPKGYVYGIIPIVPTFSYTLKF